MDIMTMPVTVWMLSASVVYLLLMGILLNTQNLISAVIFKVIPFFLGGYLLLVLLKVTGIL